MIGRSFSLFLIFCFAGCASLSTARPDPQPAPLAEELASPGLANLRVMFEHPVRGWWKTAVTRGRTVTVFQYRGDADTQVVVSVHRKDEVDPLQVCDERHTWMMLNGMPVSVRTVTESGGWCRYTYTGQRSGRRFSGIFSSRTWRFDYTVIMIGQWPIGWDGDRTRDFDAMSRMLVLHPGQR
jgi:hypothetical protein